VAKNWGAVGSNQHVNFFFEIFLDEFLEEVGEVLEKPKPLFLI
jgi:hypothetical protein